MTDKEFKLFEDLLDQKFTQLEKKIEELVRDTPILHSRISKVERELATRPTVYQLLAACIAVFTAAVTFAALIL